MDVGAWLRTYIGYGRPVFPVVQDPWRDVQPSVLSRLQEIRPPSKLSRCMHIVADVRTSNVYRFLLQLASESARVQ